MTRLSIWDVLWQLPAAVAYQVNILYWQWQGTDFIVDDRALIRKMLCLKQT